MQDVYFQHAPLQIAICPHLTPVAEVDRLFVHNNPPIDEFHPYSFASTAPSFCAYPPVRMKLLGVFSALGVWHIVHLTCAQVTGGGIGAGETNFAEGGISGVGVAAVHAIAPGDEIFAEDLIEHLEEDDQTAGETPCPPRPFKARKRSPQPAKNYGRFELAPNQARSTWLVHTTQACMYACSQPPHMYLAQV